MKSPHFTTPEDLILSNLGLARLVVRKCLNRFGPVVEADDLLQEARLGLIRAAHQFDPSRGVRFSTYAFRCCWRACLDAVRSPAQRRLTQCLRTRRLRGRKMEGSAALAGVISPSVSPDDQAAAAELWASAMLRLNPNEREVIRLRFEQGMTYAALAQRRNCSREFITAVEHKALAKLRRAVGEET